MTEDDLDLSKLPEKTRREIECGRATLARKTKLSPTDEALNATTDHNLQGQILGNSIPPKAEKVRSPDRVPPFAERAPSVKPVPTQTKPAATTQNPGNPPK